MALPSCTLFIAGMHRSGTSYLGESCGALGLTLPRDAGAPAEDNPRGHFEPQAVVRLNDAILAGLGATWLRVGPLTLPAPDDALMARMDAAVAESFGNAGRIVVKDPRLSLTLPSWRAWAQARGVRSAVLIALRDPRDVAHSLYRRNGFRADAAMLSWTNHMLSAVSGSEGMARQLVPFPDWTRDPGAMLARIAALAGDTVPPGAMPDDAAARAAASFIPEAVHVRDRTARDSPVAALALDLHRLLLDASAQGKVPPSAALVVIADRFAALSATAREVEDAAAAVRREDQAMIARLSRNVAAQRDRIRATEAQRDEGMAGLIEQLRGTEAQRDFAAESAATARADAERIQRLLAAAEARHKEGIAALTAQLRATEEQRDRQTATVAARKADADALAEQLAATEAQRDDGIAALNRQLRATEAQRDVEAEAARTARTEAETIRRQLAAAEAQHDEMTAIAYEWRESIDDLEDRNAQLQRYLDATEHALAEALEQLARERLTVVRPIYRRSYRTGGRVLRRMLPAETVDWLRRRLPVAGGVPRGLAFVPQTLRAPAAQGYGGVPVRAGDRADIFILSIINWDFRTQRPQHLATRMAAAGHRVFYLEMEPDAGEGSAREVAPGVQVIRLPGRGLRGLTAYTGVPGPAQTRAWVDHFHVLADTVGASAVSHVVIEHPWWWNLARHLSPEYQITFDCMDDIAGFSNTQPQVLEAELDMIARADKMIVSSQYLHDKYSPMRSLRLVRNGTDVSHFIRDNEAAAPEWLPARTCGDAIRVGYVGAIAEWFDTDLLEAVARSQPDLDIHLCGAITAEAPLRLGSLGNVTLHGEIPYADVPGFLQQMDVLIIPFRLLPIIKACDPVKFYEYAAVMRPTVSTSLPELARAGDLVFRADDAAGFAAAIRRAAPLARDADFGRRLRDYALGNAWDYRAADMLAEMRREPRLSVVVLHYGDDTDMTLACLHALLGRGDVYPDLEVVLVDNGSSAEVLDALRARAADDDRIVMVENGENLGFARGNNRGIAAASGEYVLLLNNDTFLAPGAALAMVRHLQRNPEIGIVGPMTNNIGNEARVEIAYADMDAMVRAARDLATGHRGQWTPIRVCAYFCAMFRRADLDRLGGLPEIYGRGMFEDDDHCATFRAAGLQMALAEDAFCHHHLSASFGALPSEERQALFARNRVQFETRWGAWTPHRYRDSRPAASLPGPR